MPRTLLKQSVKEEDAKEAATQVLTKGLVKRVVTPNGIRYEITDAGWQFVREYEAIMVDLGESASNFTANANGLPTEELRLLVSLPPRPELTDFMRDPRQLIGKNRRSAPSYRLTAIATLSAGCSNVSGAQLTRAQRTPFV